MAHVAIDTATVGSGPLARVAGNGEYSLDGGQTDFCIISVVAL